MQGGWASEITFINCSIHDNAVIHVRALHQTPPGATTRLVFPLQDTYGSFDVCVDSRTTPALCLLLDAL